MFKDRNGVPVQKIALTNLIFALATLIAATVLTLTNHQDQANLLYGAMFGGASGAALTTVIAVSNGKNGTP